MHDEKTEFFEINKLKCVNINNGSNITFLGFAVLAGSNFETPLNAGISHFIEHMFFKGTSARTWRDINDGMAEIGANQNAYTDNTEVAYHCSVPCKNTPKAVDLLFDMFFNSSFPEDEIEKERGVILEEKKSCDDDHTNYFYSQIGKKLMTWNKGHPIIGEKNTILKITQKDLKNYLSQKYGYKNILFMCCGNISTHNLKDCIKKSIPKNHEYFENDSKNKIDLNVWNEKININNKIKLNIKRKGVTQAYVNLFLPGYSSNHKLYWAQKVLFNYLGGGMFSILFSRIREELGLCYSVGAHTFYSYYPDCVVPLIYSITSEKNIDLFIEETEKIILKTVEEKLDSKIFNCSKIDIVSSWLRHTETSKGMANLMLLPYLHGERTSVKEMINGIESVTEKDCKEVAEMTLNRHKIWTIMRPEL